MDHPQWLLPGDAPPDTSTTADYFLPAPSPPLVLQFEKQFGDHRGTENRVLLSTHQSSPVGGLLQYYAQYAGLPATLEGVEFSCLNATLQPTSTPPMWSLQQGDVIRVYAQGQQKTAIENFTQGETLPGVFRCNFRGCGQLFKENSDALLRHMNVHYNTQGLFYCSHGNCPLVFPLESELQTHLAEHTALSPLINLALASPQRHMSVNKSTQTTPDGDDDASAQSQDVKTETPITSTDESAANVPEQAKAEPVPPITPETSLPQDMVASSPQDSDSDNDQDEYDSGEEVEIAFKCPEPGCDAGFERRIQLAEHKTFQHPPKAHNTRPATRKSARTPATQTSPTKKVTKKPSKKIPKKAPKAETGSSAKVSRKKKVAPPEDLRPHVCGFPGCGMAFKRGEHLKRHFASKHLTTKYYVCPVKGCFREFTRRDNRNQHLSRHIRQKDGLKDIEKAGLLRHLKGLSPPPTEPEPPSEVLPFEPRIQRKRVAPPATSKSVDKTLVWRVPNAKRPRPNTTSSASFSNELEPRLPPTPVPSQNAPTISHPEHSGEAVSKHEKEVQASGPSGNTGPRTRFGSKHQRREDEKEDVQKLSSFDEEGEMKGFGNRNLLLLLEQAAEAIADEGLDSTESAPQDIAAAVEESSGDAMRVRTSEKADGQIEDPNLNDIPQSTGGAIAEIPLPDNVPVVLTDTVLTPPKTAGHADEVRSEARLQAYDNSMVVMEEYKSPKKEERTTKMAPSTPCMKTRSHSDPQIFETPPSEGFSHQLPSLLPISPADESEEPTSPLVPTSPITPRSARPFPTQSPTKLSRRPRTIHSSSVPRVCHHCHITSSTQWRHGPNGERLCNACGLCYNKHGRMRVFSMYPVPEPQQLELPLVRIVHEDPTTY